VSLSCLTSLQVELDLSIKEDSEPDVQRDYFDRCVAVMSASQKLADTAIMLTRAVEPYQTGVSFSLIPLTLLLI